MTTTDEQQSLDLVRSAALRGVPQAQLIYGQMLLDGRLLERNPASAFFFFERAAEGGDLMACNMVGRCLDQGWGVARSPRLAEPWFRRAAERGLDWGMYNLATLLALGQNGIPLNRIEALHWLRKAVALGHAKSMNILGGFYEDGWEVRRDRASAREWYRKSALGGDFRGKFNFARLLAEEGNEPEALYWLRQVPATATPAFLSKMIAFLRSSSLPGLRSFAESLTQPHEQPPDHQEPTAARDLQLVSR